MVDEVDVRRVPEALQTSQTRQPLDQFGAARFLNRELSWLDFAARLLDLAGDEELPVLERVKFLAIFSSGLDEFFQVRVAGLKDQYEAAIHTLSADGKTVAEQLVAVRDKALGLIERHGRIFTESVLIALGKGGIWLVDYGDLSDAAKAELAGIFDREIYPVLTPLAVDPGHPFPYISNLSLNLAVTVEDAVNGERRFARVKVPPLLPRFVPLGDGERFVPLEQVIAGNLDRLFPEMRIGATHTFRVTRNADIDFADNDADDLLAAVEIELRRRRFGRAVRLEVDQQMSREVVELLVEELELVSDDVYRLSAPLDLAQLWAIASMDRPELKEPSWSPMTPARLTAGEEPIDLFATLRERDVLVHHPYDSFASSVEAFITQAAADPDVLAIKQTLYRTSGDAQFVSALAGAAEDGKQVAALIELTARFDEQRNIAWARQLEQAGVHVVYGVMGLKTHAKTTLVVRREEYGIRRYFHIGTGNYNSDTARVYEDIGLLSANPDLGADLTDLFNHLTGFSRAPTTRSLVLAPDRFRPWVLEQIAHQSSLGEQGRIVIKVNGLTDPEVIDALYLASQMGVEISLLVRGMCCLRPGVSGLSERILVRSIVGRFLEHSRIYRFGHPTPEVLAHTVVGYHEPPDPAAHPAQYFIGSADLIERNLDYRIEALTPVNDPELSARLEDILTLNFGDDINSWALDVDGTWNRVPTSKGVSAHRRLEDLAIERARRRRPTEI